MFKNYFKTAFRNFRRNKVFSLINIAGLAIGISASLVIYLIVAYQFGFDKFEKNGDRIYRVVSDMHFPDQIFKLPGVPSPMGAAVQKEISGIEIAAPFHLFNGEANVTVPAINNTAPALFKRQPYIIFADDNYFKLINYKWLAGNPSSLKDPFKIVLAESRARTYFPAGSIDKIIGRTINYNDSIHVSVAGIVKDLDEITEFNFKEFISLSTIPNSGLKGNYSWDEWRSINSSSQLFLKFKKGIAAAQVKKQIKEIRARNVKDDNLKTEHQLQALADIHFNAAYGNFDEMQINKSTLYGLLVLAAFLLLLGCINFINLTTAQSVQRAKEIGIRKTMGSSKPQLMMQFLIETLLLTMSATLLSIALTPFIFKAFADYIPHEITVDMLLQAHTVIFIIILIIVVSFLSGFYPAFVLTRFKPITALKDQAFTSSTTTRRALVRKSLTVAQFIIAQFFIIATMVVGKQIHYSMNKDLGYKRDAVLNVELPFEEKYADKRSVMLQKMQVIPEIEKVSLAGSAPATNGISFQTMNFDNGKKKIETTVEIKYADSSYFDLYEMKLLAGRYVEPADSVKEYVINNTYAKFLGFDDPAAVVGRFIEHSNGKIPIVGVIADIHTHSTHEVIKPLAFSSDKRNYFMLHIALRPRGENGEVWKHAINKIEKEWKQLYPDRDFEYAFFDQRIAKFYDTEKKTSVLLSWATGLAIFISTLGLLGLVIYTTNQRTKEIGVRKVLGASVKQIVLLLSKDFVQLILLAFLIAAPIAWWVMKKWLQDFAYRTTLDWWVFAGGGLLMVSIAFIILSIRTIKAANANPVKSLRTGE